MVVTSYQLPVTSYQYRLAVATDNMASTSAMNAACNSYTAMATDGY